MCVQGVSTLFIDEIHVQGKFWNKMLKVEACSNDIFTFCFWKFPLDKLLVGWALFNFPFLCTWHLLLPSFYFNVNQMEVNVMWSIKKDVRILHTLISTKLRAQWLQKMTYIKKLRMHDHS
jgi:hypothetical protein